MCSSKVFGLLMKNMKKIKDENWQNGAHIETVYVWCELVLPSRHGREDWVHLSHQ